VNKGTQQKRNYTSNLYILLIFFTSLIIAPGFLSDPFNSLKASSLLFSAIILSISLLNYSLVKTIFFSKKINILFLLFPLNLLITFVANDASKIQQLFGVFGRRTGLITYMAFFLFFVITLALHNSLKVEKIYYYFYILGIVSAVYSLLQPTGLFRIETLASKNLQPFGFFGNTNFQSAFLGFAFLMTFNSSTLDGETRTLKNKLFINSGRFLLLYALYKTQAQQGFLVIFSGLVVIFLIHTFIKKNLIVFLLSLSIAISLFVIFIIGLFNFGPLSSIIFQESVKARNFYWFAGVRMMGQNLTTGLGLDSYGDWWWKYRGEEAVSVLGSENFSTAAHNIFLDLGVGGGILLLVSYLVFNLIILVAAIKHIKSKIVNVNFIVTISLWISFQIYSLISINHIGIGIWGWIFAGIMYNLSHNWSSTNHQEKYIRHPSKSKFFVAIVIASIVSTPGIIESRNFEEIREDNSIIRIIEYSKSYDYFSNNLLYASYKLKNLGDNESSIEINRILVNKFPNFYDGWNLLYYQISATPSERLLAVQEMVRIDPNSKKF
jgi:hypothetical protein